MNPRTNTPIDKDRGASQSRSNSAICARDIMTTSIVTVQPETPVHQIAQLLSDKHMSAVLVVDRGSLVGIVSEGDLLHRQEVGTDERVQRQESGTDERASWPGESRESRTASATETKSHGMRAGDVMTRNVVTVSTDTSLADVVRTLRANHIRKVPVMRGENLVGVVGRSDIMRALAARPEDSRRPSSRDDDMIRYQVIDTLLSIPGTSPWLTTVNVSNGVVELHGSIQEESVRDPSRIALENIPDVVEVKDHRSILNPY